MSATMRAGRGLMTSDAVGEKHRLGDGMGDEQRRGAALLPERRQFEIEAAAGQFVDGAEGLVEQHQPRLRWRGSGRSPRAGACRRTAPPAGRARSRRGRRARSGRRPARGRPAGAPASGRARCWSDAPPGQQRGILEGDGDLAGASGWRRGRRRRSRPRRWSAARGRRECAAAWTCRSPTGRPARSSIPAAVRGRPGRQRLDGAPGRCQSAWTTPRSRRAAAPRSGRRRAGHVRARCHPCRFPRGPSGPTASGVTVLPSSARVSTLALTVSSVNQPKPCSSVSGENISFSCSLAWIFWVGEVEAGVGEHLHRQLGRRVGVLLVGLPALDLAAQQLDHLVALRLQRILEHDVGLAVDVVADSRRAAW